MLNNENNLEHSPSKELAVLKKKIEIQAQKSTAHDEKIKELQAKIEAAKHRTQQKKQILVQTQQNILEEIQKGQKSYSSSAISSHQPNQPNSSFASSEILGQLRQHFKALRHQMMSEGWGEDDEEDYEDEVDVDNMTYQELLELGQKIGKVSKGLDLKKMESLTVKKYHNANPNQPFDCAICRDQLQDGADCIELHCHHVFHDECIKGWLNVEKHCPNCKRQIKLGGQTSEKNQN